MKTIEFDIAKFIEHEINISLTINDIMFINSIINSTSEDAIFIDFLQRYSVEEKYCVLFNEMGLTVEWRDCDLDEDNNFYLQEFKSDLLRMTSLIENSKINIDSSFYITMTTTLNRFIFFTELLWYMTDFIVEPEDLEYMDSIQQKLMSANLDIDQVLGECLSIVENEGRLNRNLCKFRVLSLSL